MLGEIFAVLSSLTQGFKKILHRSVLKKEDSISYAFLYECMCAILLIPFLFFDFLMPTDISKIFLAVLSGILWTGIAYIGFKAYSKTELALKTTFSQSDVLFTFVLSIIFLREIVTVTKFFGVLLVFIGILIVSYKKGSKFGILSDKGVILSIIAALLTSFAIIIDKYAQAYYSATTYSFLVYLIPAVLLLPFAINKKKQMTSIISNSFWQIFAAAVLSTISYYFMLRAFSFADASIVYTITRASILVTIIGGIIFLKEKTDVPKRIFVGIIILAGVILLLF